MGSAKPGNESDIRMSLPRFYSRIGDAITGVAGQSEGLKSLVASTTVRLEAPSELEADTALRAGFDLVVNLCDEFTRAFRF